MLSNDPKNVVADGVEKSEGLSKGSRTSDPFAELALSRVGVGSVENANATHTGVLGEGQCAAHREQVQRFVDGNQFLKGKVVLANELIVSGDFVLYVSRDALSHIKERHSDPSKPGSTFVDGVDLQGVLAKVIARATTERANGRVKWLGADTGATIGYMGVKLGSPEEVAAMSDYQMPDGKREIVKLATGNRDATCQISVIASELGKLSDGKTALSLITMFPGGTTVGGKEIPLDRGLFAREGMYFVVE